MRVYKEFSTSDLYDLVVDVLSSDLHSYDLAELIYDFIDSSYEEIDETTICDFMRYDMQVMTLDEIKDNYSNLIDEDDDEEQKSDDFEVEDFLSYHSCYLGSYEEDSETFYVFTEF